ncbi:hypothetical protein BDV93DRAFT_508182 [Ceratobasidium sp. AG-I]|nr:hypothetical protein BDV93DRAFT_508182 [Ceratobasidium sp. AG-I]
MPIVRHNRASGHAKLYQNDHCLICTVLEPEPRMAPGRPNKTHQQGQKRNFEQKNIEVVEKCKCWLFAACVRIKGYVKSRFGCAVRDEYQPSAGEFDRRELCPGRKRRLCAVDRQSSSKGMRRPSGGIRGVRLPLNYMDSGLDAAKGRADLADHRLRESQDAWQIIMIILEPR